MNRTCSILLAWLLLVSALVAEYKQNPVAWVCVGFVGGLFVSVLLRWFLVGENEPSEDEWNARPW